MGFKSVFRALQDVFPQVDIRILKAAAIEHSKDADAAVEFILFEVLPSISSPVEHSSPIVDGSDNPPVMSSPLMGTSHARSDLLVAGSDNPPVISSPLVDASHACSDPIVGRSDNPPIISSPLGETSNAVSDCQDFGNPYIGLVQLEEQIHLLDNKEVVEEPNRGLLRQSSSVIGEVGSVAGEDSDDILLRERANINSTYLYEEPADPTIVNVQISNNFDHLIVTDESEGPNIMHQFPNCESHQGSNAELSSKIQDDRGPSQCISVPHAIIQDLNERAAYGSCSFSYNACPSELDIGLLKRAHDSSSIYEDTQEFSEATMENEIIPTTEHKEPISRASSNSGSERVVFDSQMVDVEDDPSYKTIVTRSGKACRIDLLEGAISDARNNKKTLFSSMESVISMMREVEQQEKAAEQAKEDALKGGLDTLAKAEDIKQMLQHAKEANDMHAGEVYGEKSILATEARELQSRLLTLSDERDKSLAILDEMRQALEGRLRAAEEVRKAAEREKLEKEDSARKALAEQELIMDKVVEESKRLQQEAEENSKLREFLMDRGHVVDILQGEIAVICKDVKLLKENFDGQVPLSKSLSSSQTSCILASSGSSSKTEATDMVPEQDEPLLLGTPKKTSTSSSVDGSSRSSSLQVGVTVDRKVLTDDDWEFFDNETELYN